MKRSHSIEDLKAMVDWCVKHKRQPGQWRAWLKDAVNAEIEATIEARKRAA